MQPIQFHSGRRLGKIDHNALFYGGNNNNTNNEKGLRKTLCNDSTIIITLY